MFYCFCCPDGFRGLECGIGLRIKIGSDNLLATRLRIYYEPYILLKYGLDGPTWTI